MARGPDGQGGGAGFSLSDQLFNAESLGDLAAEFSVLPDFDAERFLDTSIARLDGLGVFARLDVIADALEDQLPHDFNEMARYLEAAMPPPLDPSRSDDDFGRFIHAVPGVLAVRHGIGHPARALDLLHAATMRFSMEYAIRPFLNRWPEMVLDRMQVWVRDPNYHVRRLVSEGTRPRLPWGSGITLDPMAPLPLLDRLHADPARFVTRSVANHLNDLTKNHMGAVGERLSHWRGQAAQEAGELDWIARHALRGAVKRGDRQALELLGYRADLPVAAQLSVPDAVAIGEALDIAVTLTSRAGGPVMVDYRLRFHRPGGAGEKVFKLKSTSLKPGQPLELRKSHRMKGNATTFRLHPGPHTIVVQVNGVDAAEAGFELLPG